jgi:hypothetical protein
MGLRRANLAVAAIAVWIAVATAISLFLFKLAAALVDRRRENLVLTSQRS